MLLGTFGVERWTLGSRILEELKKDDKLKLAAQIEDLHKQAVTTSQQSGVIYSNLEQHSGEPLKIKAIQTERLYVVDLKHPQYICS